MSTGFIQPTKTVGIQMHEFVGYQVIYSPIDFLQLNFGWSIFKKLVTGGKIEVYNSDHFLRAVSLNLDATFKLQNKRWENEYIFPNINTTIGFDKIQLSISLTPYRIEKFRKVQEIYSGEEYDGYTGDGQFYLFPALIQIGLMGDDKELGIKSIAEFHTKYDGRNNEYSLAMVTFGSRKYWSSIYIDFAVSYIVKQSNPYPQSFFFIPYLAIGVFL